MRDEIRKIQELMEAAEYVTDAPIATSVHLAAVLKKPLLIEGHAGVGKTEIAKVMARVLNTNLIRLQCYEGLDASAALYEWNYQKQLLHIKLHERSQHSAAQEEQEIFSEPFLLRRPLLQAITQETAPVLLIDEVDRCVTARTFVATTTGLKRADEIKPGDELVSFDPSSFSTVRSTVKRIVPRETTELMRVLVGGRFLEVTPEHKFLRFGPAGSELVRADELRRGDRLPLFKAPPGGSDYEPAFSMGDSIVQLTSSGRRLLHEAYRASGRTYAELSTTARVSRAHLRNVIQPSACRASLRADVIQRLAGALKVKDDLSAPELSHGLRVRQTVAFYELLGYIVADGCFTSDRLCIADKDRKNLEEYARKFKEAFGEAPRILKGPHRNYELTYHSLPLGRFLHQVFGSAMVRSRNRVLPGFVFALPSEKKAAIVRGYFDGEGWVGDHQIAATSASPYLLVGIQHLLTALGVDSLITSGKAPAGSFGRGTYFTLSITDMAAFARAVGFCSPAKQRLLGDARSPRFTRTELLPEIEVRAALEAVCARETLNGKVAHQTVYDILAGRVRPNVSSLRRIASGVDAPELRVLLDAKVVLGEVTAVEEISASETVYDFVMDGQPYFVANQIITHNCDEEFEAFMLEIFSDWQITIPEVGTIKATHPPHVILTSNRNRELSDALRRRCLYLWIDYPPFDKEIRIVERKIPGINARLARQVARFMETLRTVRLAKVPGVAETLDWAQALTALHADHLDETLVFETLGCVLKDADDIKRFRTEVAGSGLGRFVPTES
jgi:MoxR-like ATPase/intein/homing endonuclease